MNFKALKMKLKKILAIGSFVTFLLEEKKLIGFFF